MSPLYERVEAPHRLEAPIHPDVPAWRPLTPDDAPALARLHAVADLSDHPEWTVPEDELRDRLTRAHVDLERDTIAAVTDAGSLVAYGLNVIDEHPETVVRVLLDGAVHPELRGRGLGRQLLQWQRGRAQQQLAASDLGLPGWIISWQSARNERGVQLAELLGFRAARYVGTMTRELAAPVEEREPRDQIEIVPWDASLSAAALEAHRAAFRDHWGSQPTTDAVWRELTTSRHTRPDLSFLALDPADNSIVVGYVLTGVFEHDFARQGFTSSYIDLIGTRREWRGKGIASALLSRVLAASKQASLQKVVLDVDTENPTGALGMYESQGFAPTGERQVALVLSY
jgi:ribosomal protein S18 acetylase RimI-like enzyme